MEALKFHARKMFQTQIKWYLYTIPYNRPKEQDDVTGTGTITSAVVAATNYPYNISKFGKCILLYFKLILMHSF